jgi:hypothetical protein
MVRARPKPARAAAIVALGYPARLPDVSIDRRGPRRRLAVPGDLA